VIASAILVFFGTNIDGFVALSALFATTEEAQQSRLAFVAAMAGFVVLLVVSGLGAAGLEILPRNSAAWIGLAPLALGLYRAYEWARPDGADAAVMAERVSASPGAFVLVLATGADNVAAYVPLFHQIGLPATLLVAAGYTIGFVVVCLVAFGVCGSAVVHAAVHRIAQPLSAALFVGVGCYVIVEALR
jgi:cadmium resistance protein CadD (predicted permease)